MARSELYHVCIVVPDILAAREHLAELLGVEWGPLGEFAFPYRRDDGTDAIINDFQLCYSIGAPHLELVAERPGTPWECNEYSNLHHIGYLVDDMEAGSQRLVATACPLEAYQRDRRSGTLGWSYHRDQLGFRIELVNAAGAPSMGPALLGGKRQFNAPLTTQL